MKTTVLILSLLLATPGFAEDVAQFSIKEWTFTGPAQTTTDAPARDCTFITTFRHESGVVMTVHGFFDGDGAGETVGTMFKVRFCPTLPGVWTLIETASNQPELQGEREGDSIECIASDSPGLWIAEGRWYARSDGSHPMIVGNTHYSFLSRQGADGPLATDAATDIALQAEYFNKLRFSLTADRYPDPDLKPFLDDDRQPTDDGRYSYRPNPAWFRERVDPAIGQGLASDVICDLIVCGPDTRESRSTLQGDSSAWLRYVAARYGSYPHVWFCLCNEWDIKEPSYSAEEIIAAGEVLRAHLPHRTTPVSVHGDSGTWDEALNGDWCDHAIMQRKLRTLGEAADAVVESQRLADGRPVVNDENGYEGAGDGFSREDILEGCLGTFLGGGYPTTGYKPGNKLGQYFWGGFDSGESEHSSSAGLGMMRRYLTEQVTFWTMQPLAADDTPFDDLPEEFRVLGNPGVEYVLGSNASAVIECTLPPGMWRIVQVDLVAGQEHELADEIAGNYRLETPDSRAVMTHLRLTESQ